MALEQKQKDPNMSICNNDHLIFEREAKFIHGGKVASSTNGARKTLCPCVEGRNYGHIKHWTKISSQYIRDINLKPKMLKLLEENVSTTL